ncbi:hypothetical protein BpHYR1_008854, partial [Brachionus plicatilis]
YCRVFADIYFQQSVQIQLHLLNPVAAPLITLRPACFRPRRACKVTWKDQINFKQVCDMMILKHLLNRIKRTSIITKV